MNNLLTRLGRNRFLKFGAPFLCLVVGGPFVLQKFSEIKFKYYRDRNKVSAEDMAEFQNKMKGPEITLESVYEKIKDMDIDNWEQVRGPRPWEEGSIEANKNRNKRK